MAKKKLTILPKIKIKIDGKKLEYQEKYTFKLLQKNKSTQLAKNKLQSQGLTPSTASLICLLTDEAGFVSPEMVSWLTHELKPLLRK